ncbi:MAG: sarcosine oxidase subunit gamma family protein [Casimicrobiaceae bacterium]
MDDSAARPIGSALPGHYGAAETGVTLAEATIATAWNVQGDPARDAFVAEAQRRFGVALPRAANTTARGADWTALWLGPRSWLLVARGEDAAAAPPTALAACRDALCAGGGALFDVSASRVAWTLAGPHAAAVLSKHCPLDFHPRAFPAGGCAQSVLGHIGLLVERPGPQPAFIAMTARSFARDAWGMLCESAAQYGYDVAPAARYR